MREIIVPTTKKVIWCLATYVQVNQTHNNMWTCRFTWLISRESLDVIDRGPDYDYHSDFDISDCKKRKKT